MGPEIIYAFFAFLGFLFWFLFKILWRILVVLLNIILIPCAFINNYVRVKFWGLPKRKIDTAIFKKNLF
jgi:hypothetical protein